MQYEVNVTIYIEAADPEEAELAVEALLDICVHAGSIAAFDIEQPEEE